MPRLTAEREKIPPSPPSFFFFVRAQILLGGEMRPPKKKDTLSYKVRNIARLSFPSFLARLPFPLFPKSVIYGQNTSLPSLIWETARRGGGNALLCLAVEAASRTHTHTHDTCKREIIPSLSADEEEEEEEEPIKAPSARRRGSSLRGRLRLRGWDET